MSLSPNHSPPLSPVLLLGLALQPLPLTPLNMLLKGLIGIMHKKHGNVFERLMSLKNPLFCIDPTDLPFFFLLNGNMTNPTLIALKKPLTVSGPIATIRGPLSTLLTLLEGKIDGDALFFTRTLIIEGDTEAILTLRNAIDGSDINIREDLSNAFGIMKRPVDFIGNAGLTLFNYAVKDLNLLASTLTSPLDKRLKATETLQQSLEESVSTLNKQARRRRKA